MLSRCRRGRAVRRARAVRDRLPACRARQSPVPPARELPCNHQLHLPWRTLRRCGRAPLPLPPRATGNSAPPAQEFGRRHRLHRERPHHAGHDAARFVPGTRGGDRRGITAARAAQQRKGTRGRSGTTSSPSNEGRAEPKTHRALSDQVNQSMALQRNKPLEITPLFSSLAPLSLPLSQASVAPLVQQERGTANPVTLSGLDIRKMLSSPGKLRQSRC